MNVAIERWNEKLVTNLTEFLNQTWANALWHDEFNNFRQSLDQWLYDMPDIQQLADTVRSKLESKNSLDKDDFTEVYKAVNKETKERIKDETVEWLKKNRNHLPM